MNRWFFRALFLLGFSVVLFSVPFSSAGQKEKTGLLTVQQVKENLERAQKGVSTLRFRLKGYYEDRLSKEKSRLEAEVTLKNPDKAFAHYTKPFEQFLYMNSEKSWLYQPDQQMVYTQKPQKGVGRVELGIGKELQQYMEKSRVSIISDRDERIVLLFLPRGDELGFERMELVLDKILWWPVKMKMETPSLVYRVTFENYRFNDEISDDLFRFEPPQEAQIVEGAIF